MAIKTYEFSGRAGYVSRSGRVFKEGEAPVWTLRLYPRTAADRAAIRATGVKNKAQEDDGSKSGVEGWYFTFRSKAEYPIVDAAGQPVEKLVGNGSEITVFLEVETFMSQKFGQQARSSVVKVRVDNLIEYVPPTETADQAANAEVPA